MDMKGAGSNTDLALHVARQLATSGVRDVCLCAGARNSPLITLLSRTPGFRLFHFFEERSAAFFALGRIKADRVPVAVVTTSGTASAELLPAVVEAHYAGLPLVLVTADRPRTYRGTGAPQSIEQNGIFGPYVAIALDLEGAERGTLGDWCRNSPCHINVCFGEPLLDRPLNDSELGMPSETASESESAFAARIPKNLGTLERFLANVSLPLVIAGEIPERDREAVKTFLLALGAPAYLEGTSGLRECSELNGLRVLSTDRLFHRLTRMKHPIDGVLRIGGVPTLRFWRDLEEKRSDLPVLSVTNLPFTGMTRSELIQTDLSAFLSKARVRRVDRDAFSDLLEWDRALYEGIRALLGKEPRSEPGMIHALSARIMESPGPRVFLGNSLPIREWDLAAIRDLAPSGTWSLGANRGANGIDGQVSTFFGFSRPNATNWAILGDLTTLYDLSAPWVLRQLSGIDCRLVVVNNGGGMIFSRMFESPAFQNRHALGFEGWAAMWGLGYSSVHEIPERWKSGSGPQIIELKPDAEATARFWSAYDELCR